MHWVDLKQTVMSGSSCSDCAASAQWSKAEDEIVEGTTAGVTGLDTLQLK